uniref:CD276 molecule n=1 Tax=Geospiza parvula TaxID=87175 RepID=A0A8C3M5Z1_GEOPR
APGSSRPFPAGSAPSQSRRGRRPRCLRRGPAPGSQRGFSPPGFPLLLPHPGFSRAKDALPAAHPGAWPGRRHGDPGAGGARGGPVWPGRHPAVLLLPRGQLQRGRAEPHLAADGHQAPGARVLRGPGPAAGPGPGLRQPHGALLRPAAAGQRVAAAAPRAHRRRGQLHLLRARARLHSAAVALQVAAPYSKPSVHLEPSKELKPGDVAEVTCHASRGYPEASVLWQDSRGANLTANVTTWQVANEEGLFEVRSVLRVLVEPGVTYSCLVLNAALRQHGHASVTITGQPLAFPAVALWVTVALAVCVVALLGVLAFVCHQKIRESCREDEERAALQLLENTESREDREQEID